MDATTFEFSQTSKSAQVRYVALMSCWMVALACLVIDLLGKNEMFFSITGHEVEFKDFVKFYDCGKIVLSNQRYSLYDQAVQNRFLAGICDSLNFHVANG